ncbi:hypothetical protein [Amycolatopsis sp. GM8]|uniref:hypothetical protein n=1 Tax=Amycolatopsis sp. GM8 TaxID=2896530 RepID=UPI001F217C86|nr:hypothetical protein [Amycolatopsis sp. GM8]
MSRFQLYRTDESRIRWRLLGGNNRVLCVGERWHADQAAALAEVALVRLVAPRADLTVEHEETALWWWRAVVGKANLVKSAQGFARRIDAERAVERFRRCAPAAVVEPGLAVFPPGRRGRLLHPVVHRSLNRSKPNGLDVAPQRPVG